MKKLHLNRLNKKSEEEFFHEISLLNNLRHPNIVSLLGTCVEEDYYALVTEYMPLGSLYELLHKKKVNLSWSIKLSIASDAAKGISFLHTQKPKILHCDIKSLNLLVEQNYPKYRVKVCDFGTAEIRHETTIQTEKQEKYDSKNIKINFEYFL